MSKLLLAVAVVAMMAGLGDAGAQTYPSRPITMVVPFPAGGGSDLIARTVSERMRVSIKQSIVVENIGGANGSIGIGRLARAAPDGYTFGLGSFSTFVANGALYALPYDLLKDFEPVSLVTTQPYVIVGRKTLPASDLKALIAWLKANPDKASAGTQGLGGSSHISAASFQNATGTRF